MIEYSYDPPYNLWSGNRSDTLNKWKINYKGSIATASALPEKGDFKGDTYNVLEDGSNYMWNGKSWDKLDANVYVGSTATANGIRGLVPPATTAQMYSLLTGMGTWQSAGDLGLALDDEVVHKTGYEEITGIKCFKNTSVMMFSEIAKGTIPQESLYRGFIFVDNTATDNDMGHQKRFGGVQSVVKNDGSTAFSLLVYKNATDSTANFGLSVGYDANETPYAMAPSTSDTRNEGRDIVTKDWIPKDTRVVHTTGSEDISGIKKFIWGLSGTKNGSMDIDNGSYSEEYYQYFTCYDANDNQAGRLILQYQQSDQRLISIQLTKKASSYDAVGFGITLKPSTNVSSVFIGNGISSLRPAGAGIKLGENTTSFKWSEIWCAQSSINSTSDERVKSNIKSISDDVLDAWGSVNWIEFQYNDAIKEKGNEHARIHTGLIAQRVASAFKQSGVPVDKYGFYLYDKWDSQEAVFDDLGSKLESAVEAGDAYGIRYTEALCIEAAYQRRRAERAEARIKALEDRLEALEAKLA